MVLPLSLNWNVGIAHPEKEMSNDIEKNEVLKASALKSPIFLLE